MPAFLEMNKLTVWFILIFFPVSLLLRNYGFPFASVLITANVILLGYVILTKEYFIRDIIRKILLLFFLLTCLSILQYWPPFDDVNRIGKSEFIVLLFILVIFSYTIYKKALLNPLNLVLIFILTFILFSASVLTSRSFHNLYRYLTYEEYIRNHFSEFQSNMADLYIDLNKPNDMAESDAYLIKAREADADHQLEKALRLYNLSIDLYPDDARRYYERGLLKLTRLRINEDHALSAVKDFKRAIVLNPSMAEAYFHKGVALGYLGFKGRALLDMRKAVLLESNLPDDEFIKKYGTSKKSFSVPADS